ncbi:hypothetical protein ABBQ32_000314 [Trebouxia sp. C0010 RCD-2024]
MQHQTFRGRLFISTYQLPRCNRHQGTKRCAYLDLPQGYPQTQKLKNPYCHISDRRCPHTSTRPVACQGSSGPSDQGEGDSAEVPLNQQGFRHAILHDFCMSIPFGSIVLAAGVVSLMFGSGKQGLGFVLAGAGILAAAFFSLVQWRAQRPSTAFTLISAGKRDQPVPVLSCLSMGTALQRFTHRWRFHT